MSSINKVILIGRLGKDPEIRTLTNGGEVANFTLATSEKWKDKSTGEKKEKTEWHNVVTYNEHLVRIIKDYLTKGSQVYIEGSLQTRKWQDKDGNDRYTTEVALKGFNSTLAMLDARQDREAQPEQATQPADSLTEDEVPF